MNDEEIAKLYAGGLSTSQPAALRAVFEAGRKSVADDAAAAASAVEAEKAAAPIVKPRKSAKPVAKAKKKK